MEVVFMKKLLCLFVVALLLLPQVVQADSVLNSKASCAMLMDYYTGDILYEHKIDEQVPIASVTKVMTILLCLEAEAAGQLSFEEEMVVSKAAAGMGGSQIFLDANAKYKVADLMKSIVVSSANDSSVAMAERLCGTQGAFVDAMNARAQQLGMTNTAFKNCTGLPEAGHVSTARDVGIMSRELLKHEAFFTWSTIWTDEMPHPGGRTTMMSNTNRLIRFYDGADGIKTGSTSEAKYCLSATAARGDMRLISVVLGAPTTDIRFDEARALLDYGFNTYASVHIVRADSVPENEIFVNHGRIKYILAYPEQDYTITAKRGETDGYTLAFEALPNVTAPIRKGDCVGEIQVLKDGAVIKTINALAMQDVEKAGVLDIFHWLLRQFIHQPLAY